MNEFTIYVIYNRNHDKFYIGQTKNLEQRLALHNNKTLGGYTAKFSGEWMVIYQETKNNRSEALKREKQLKSYRGREFVRSFIPG